MMRFRALGTEFRIHALTLLAGLLALILGMGSLTAFADDTAPGTQQTAGQAKTAPEEDASGFVSVSDEIPEAILDLRFYSTYNFLGQRAEGYEEPLALLTKEEISEPNPRKARLPGESKRGTYG